jgi:antitoxin component YwqK of YwqJK toxin-antitoxin module
MNIKYKFIQLIVLFLMLLRIELFSQISKLSVDEFGTDSTNGIIYRIGGEMIKIEEGFYKHNNKKEYEFTELNGKLNGTFRSRYPNGMLKIIESYVYGVPAGTWLFFYPNGEIQEEWKYSFIKEDIFLGTCSDTTIVPIMGNGYLLSKDTLVSFYNCKKPDYKIIYFPNGKIKSEEYYFKNMRNGKWKYFSETGELIKEEEYLEDKLNK